MRSLHNFSIFESIPLGASENSTNGFMCLCFLGNSDILHDDLDMICFLWKKYKQNLLPEMKLFLYLCMMCHLACHEKIATHPFLKNFGCIHAFLVITVRHSWP